MLLKDDSVGKQRVSEDVIRRVLYMDVYVWEKIQRQAPHDIDGYYDERHDMMWPDNRMTE